MCVARAERAAASTTTRAAGCAGPPEAGRPHLMEGQMNVTEKELRKALERAAAEVARRERAAKDTEAAINRVHAARKRRPTEWPEWERE